MKLIWLRYKKALEIGSALSKFAMYIGTFRLILRGGWGQHQGFRVRVRLFSFCINLEVYLWSRRGISNEKS
jgi:hypothetical protein